MNDKHLVEQLKMLRAIRPDNNWVISARSNLVSEANQRTSLRDIFGFMLAPRPIVASVLAATVVVIVFGASVVQEDFRDDFIGNSASLVKYNAPALDASEEISKETVQALNEITSDADILVESSLKVAAPAVQEYTVIFKENSDEQELFKKAIRDKVEAKIATIRDSFAQLEDGDSAKEISLNPRRFEESFKLADPGIAVQVESLLQDAQKALDEGDLINALDLVVAMEKLID